MDIKRKIYSNLGKIFISRYTNYTTPEAILGGRGVSSSIIRWLLSRNGVFCRGRALLLQDAWKEN
jgi:hypothetical protein